MIAEEMFALYNPWCYLQQPAHPTAGLDASFRSLLAAIDMGWEIVDPILFSRGENGEVMTYYFTLLHPALGQIHQLSVSANNEVTQFVESASHSIKRYK